MHHGHYPGTGIYNKVIWTQDGDSNWDPHNMNNPGTPQVYIKDTGIYLVTCGLGFFGGSTQDIFVRIFNNNKAPRAVEHSVPANSTVPTYVNVSWTGRQSAGSYLEIEVMQNGGWSPMTSVESHFSVTRVA